MKTRHARLALAEAGSLARALPVLLAPLVAWMVVPLYIAGICAVIGLQQRLGVPGPDLAEGVVLVIGFGAFAVVGSLLVATRPAHPIGWIMAALALMAGICPAGDAYAAYVMTTYGRPDALATAGAGVQSWSSRLAHDRLRITVEVPQPLDDLPAAVEVAAYRIVQEALTNVACHAEARSCVVSLARDEVAGALRLAVADDGCGLPTERRAGVGLASMRERAEELGGSCVVEALPQGGTRVHAELPLGGAVARGGGLRVSPIRVLVADDHPFFRDGLRALLETTPDTELAGEVQDGQQAFPPSWSARHGRTVRPRVPCCTPMG